VVPLAEVYCFSGEVEIAPLWPETLAAAGVAPTTGTVIIKADQLVSIDLSRSLPLVERRSVDDAVKNFWVQNSFKGSTKVPAPAGDPLVVPSADPRLSVDKATVLEGAPESVPILPNTDFTPYKKAISIKNIGLGSSSLIALAGLGAQAFGLYSISNGDSGMGNNFIMGGGIGIGVSVVVMVATLFIGAP
jgi:hypothetical protein